MVVSCWKKKEKERPVSPTLPLEVKLDDFQRDFKQQVAACRIIEAIARSMA